MKTARFGIAAVLSGFLHLALLAFLFASGRPDELAPPVMLEAYGDSDREGFPNLTAVTLVPGTYRKGDEHTPGGDEQPEQRTAEPMELSGPPEQPPELFGPESPPSPPLPQLPTTVPNPSTVPQPAPPPRAPEAKRPETSPKGSMTGSGLPGEKGGSQLPLGTPSAGGSVGSRRGFRMIGGGKPPYPEEARQAQMEGISVLWLRISAEGRVVDAKLTRSSGHPVLDTAALRWIRTRRFYPTYQGNTPVAVETPWKVEWFLFARSAG